MKISTFHLMPHRELPDDFEQRYESVWVTPPWHELADADWMNSSMPPRQAPMGSAPMSIIKTPMVLCPAPT